MSSFDVYALIKDIKQFIKGSRVEKFYQLSSEDFKFTVHIKDLGKHEFVYKLGKRLFLSRYSRKVPERPSSFAMLLRKYLSGGFIEDVYQHDFDRIIVFKIHNYSDYNLIFELFGKGNIVLTDSNFNIIHAYEERVERERIIEAGKKYEFPRKKYENIDEKLLSELSRNKPIVKVLAGDLQLGKLYAEEILFRLGIDKYAKNIDESLAKEILKELDEMIKSIGNDKPRIVLEENMYIDLIPIRLRSYEGYDFIEFDRFYEACDEYFTRIDILSFQKRLEEYFNEKISQLIQRLKKQVEACKNYINERNRYKRIADKIFERYYELEELRKVLLESIRRRGLEETLKIVEENRDKNYVLKMVKDIKEKKILIKIDEDIVEIDMDKNVYEVANEYYNKSKKAGEKVKAALEFIRKTNDEIKLLRNEKEKKFLEELQKELPKKRRIVKKEWYEKFRWFISSDGFLVIAGRDSKTNEIIVKKYMSDKDIFVHADYYGGACVVIKTDGKEVPDRTIKEAMDFAASYSRAWKDGFSYIDTYWVHANQVTKSPPHGEYVKTGAFVIKGKRNYGRGVLRICIGVKIRDNEFKILSSPETAADKNMDYYLKIVPGREKPKVIAERIRRKILEYLNKRGLNLKEEDISLDEILKHIPGESEII